MSDDHSAHHVNYLFVFIVLCVFTGLSVVFDVADMKGKTVLGFNGTTLLTVLVLGVALAKALCVMAFFMHLKFERNWKYVLLAPTIILACGIPLALLPDIGVHYYYVSAPQEQELRTALHTVVRDEDKSQPLSDEQIAAILKKDHHYDISVGRVAHFRGVLDILPAEQRKAE